MNSLRETNIKNHTGYYFDEFKISTYLKWRF